MVILHIFFVLFVFTLVTTIFYISYDERHPFAAFHFSSRLKYNNLHKFPPLSTDTFKPSPANNKSALTRRLELENEVEVLLQRATETKNILVYSLPFKDPYMVTPDRNKCGNCKILWNKKYIDDPNTKAVLFYFDRLHQMPRKRRADQLWGFWTREAPPASRVLRNIRYAGEVSDRFNFTMSFRRDADIWDPYDTATTILAEAKRSADGGDMNEQIDKIYARKTGLAAWVVSNCGATPGAKTRRRLSDDLVKAGLNIDRRGRCFPSSKAISGSLRDFVSGYKFYMAFENSWHCRDYVTEKATVNALMSGTVPVIYGATKEDLLEALPPNSFISADDFETPALLAVYLNYLDKNEKEYKKYLQWRTLDFKDMPNYMREANFCQLCRVLHGINVDDLFNSAYHERYADKPLFNHYPSPRKSLSIRDWYYGSENRECLPTF